MRRFAPPLLLMAVIYFLSAQPDLNSGLGVWDTIGRKFVHAAVYGALWFLWWRALRTQNPLPRSRSRCSTRSPTSTTRRLCTAATARRSTC